MDMNNGTCCTSKLTAAGIVAIGLFLAGFFPGYYYYQSKVNANFVTVKGLAELDVKADLAVWDLKYVVTGDNLQMAQQEMNRQLQVIETFLKGQGLTQDEFNEGSINTTDLLANPYRNGDITTARYILSQTLTVRSPNVDLVEKALSRTGDLIAQGIIFDNQYGSPVSYIFTKLNDIKPQMLEEATKNAADAANEFAKASNSQVGRIRRASQGVFSILPRDQTMNAMEMQQIDKKVRVVSTIEYWLE